MTDEMIALARRAMSCRGWRWMPGMADQFYRERVDQHLRIGIRAIELLRGLGTEQLHSRKLRSFDEVAFQ